MKTTIQIIETFLNNKNIKFRDAKGILIIEGDLEYLNKTKLILENSFPTFEFKINTISVPFLSIEKFQFKYQIKNKIKTRIVNENNTTNR